MCGKAFDFVEIEKNGSTKRQIIEYSKFLGISCHYLNMMLLRH